MLRTYKRKFSGGNQMSQRLLKSLVIGSFALVVSMGQALAAEYDHSVEVENMAFSWKVDGENLAVKMEAKTEGWVGIGFNPSEKMKDANYVLGYVKKGKAEIVDEFGTTKTGHKNDTKVGGVENATLISGTEEGGMTTIEFTIPLDSGDEKDGKLEVDGDTVVLLAYGAGRDSFKSKHKYRTSVTVNLGTGEVKN